MNEFDEDDLLSEFPDIDPQELKRAGKVARKDIRDENSKNKSGHTRNTGTSHDNGKSTGKVD